MIFASTCGRIRPTVDTRRSIGSSVADAKLAGLVSVMP
jgi:hypothetical protein